MTAVLEHAPKLIFELIEKSDGGYVAACYEHHIYAEEPTLEAVVAQVESGIEQTWAAKGELPPSRHDIQMVLRRA